MLMRAARLVQTSSKFYRSCETGFTVLPVLAIRSVCFHGHHQVPGRVPRCWTAAAAECGHSDRDRCCLEVRQQVHGD